MRRTQLSDSVAASRNPRARSIAVSPAVMALEMVKREGRASISEFPSEGAVLEGGEERVQLGQRGAVRGFQLVHGGDAAEAKEGWLR